MDSGLRLAWTQIVTAADYDEHMAAIGQADAAAALTADLIRHADLRPGARVVIVGAGTGQMFELLDPDLFRPFRLICTDLNRKFLARLRDRVTARHLSALILADDIERTALGDRPDLLLASLLLEHIEWRKGVQAITALRAAACGIIIQENPTGMTAAVTPGRRVPDSIASAVQSGQPRLIDGRELLGAFKDRAYECFFKRTRDVADGKRLTAMLFRANA
jgi:SAM-dependent methyltransferase